MTRDNSEQNFDDRDYESWQAAATAALKGRPVRTGTPNMWRQLQDFIIDTFGCTLTVAAVLAEPPGVL